MAIHVYHTLDIDDIPEQCIKDCSSSGDVSEAVAYWLEKLNFSVDRNKAIDCLEGYGAWDREDMEQESDETIAQRILWIACTDFSEFVTWKQANPDEPDENASSGSTVFVLE